MRSKRRVVPLSWVGIAALALVAGLSQARSAPLELAVKATFLVKFAPFVDWPSAAFASADTPVTICVMTDDPLAPLLDEAVTGEKDGNRPIVAKRIAPDGTALGCHIFYFEPDSQAGATIAAGLRNRPVLTATSESNAPPPQAMVTFVADRNRVSFDIDNTAVSRAGLAIGSSLLALARNVTRAP